MSFTQSARSAKEGGIWSPKKIIPTRGPDGAKAWFKESEKPPCPTRDLNPGQGRVKKKYGNDASQDYIEMF
ncbi:MAG: hypothetical protein NVSMB9_10720 [Isosphaeraceae bacterium]